MKDNLDEVMYPHDSDKDARYPMAGTERKGKDEKEIPRIKGLRDPDTLDKSTLVSNRYSEYR